MDIVIATRNRKKAEELRRITSDMPLSILTLDDFPGCPETEEDGSTFEANAIKKAVEAAGYTGKPALADDSGLEVYALGGAPGVFSARYSGEGATDSRNTEKLLSEMKSIGKADRGARFACCIALAFPGGGVETFCGHAEGSIGMEPRGANGFGYDPVFYPAGSDRTFAEMGESEKDALSHRGKALRFLHDYLITLTSKKCASPGNFKDK